MQAVENDSPVASVGQGLPGSSPSSSPSSPSGLGHPGGQAEVGRFGCLGGAIGSACTRLQPASQSLCFPGRGEHTRQAGTPRCEGEIKENPQAPFGGGSVSSCGVALFTPWAGPPPGLPLGTPWEVAPAPLKSSFVSSEWAPVQYLPC